MSEKVTEPLTVRMLFLALIVIDLNWLRSMSIAFCIWPNPNPNPCPALVARGDVVCCSNFDLK